ncbi:unnamed protein product [Closterium sp. Naga37s-1]|nr:unnamed protein product [Closterium sp. Naga37s-1]
MRFLSLCRQTRPSSQAPNFSVRANQAGIALSMGRDDREAVRVLEEMRGADEPADRGSAQHSTAQQQARVDQATATTLCHEPALQSDARSGVYLRYVSLLFSDSIYLPDEALHKVPRLKEEEAAMADKDRWLQLLPAERQARQQDYRRDESVGSSGGLASFPWAVAVMGWVLPGDVVRPFMGLAAHATARAAEAMDVAIIGRIPNEFLEPIQVPALFFVSVSCAAAPLLLHSPARAHLMPCVLTCAALLQPPGCWVLVPPTLTPSPVLLLPVRAWQCMLMRDPVTLPSGNVVDRPVILTHLLNHPPRVTLGNGRHVARRRELGGPLAVHALLPPAPTAARPPTPPFPPAWSEGGARCMVEARRAAARGAGVAPASCAPPRPLPPRHMLARLPIRHPPFFLSFPRPSFAPPRPSPSHVRTAAAGGGGGKDEAMSVKTCPLSPLSSLMPPPSTNAPHSILPGTLCCTAAATHTPTSPCCGVTTTRRTRKALAHKALSPPPPPPNHHLSSTNATVISSARTPAPPASLSRVALCTGVLRARHGDDTHARGVWLSDGEWRALHGVRGTLHGVRGTLHGVRGTLHGVRGTLHGVRGTLHGVRGTLHGVRGTLHGVRGTLHGVRGTLHGVSGAVHGVSGAVHGVSGAVHGVSGAVRGVSGAVHGVSGAVHGPKGRSACTSRPLASTFPSTHTLLRALFPPAHPPTPVPHTTLRNPVAHLPPPPPPLPLPVPLSPAGMALLEVLVKAMLRVPLPPPTLATLVRYLALGIVRPAPSRPLPPRPMLTRLPPATHHSSSPFLAPPSHLHWGRGNGGGRLESGWVMGLGDAWADVSRCMRSCSEHESSVFTYLAMPLPPFIHPSVPASHAHCTPPPSECVPSHPAFSPPVGRAGAERGGAGDGGSDTARVHSCHFIYPPPPLSHLLSFPTSSSRTCLVTHLSDLFPACPLPRMPPSPCAPLTACPLSLRPPFHAPPFPCTPLSLRPPPRRQAAQGSAAGGSSPRDSGKAMLARAIAGEAAGVPFVGAPQEAAPCIVFPAGSACMPRAPLIIRSSACPSHMALCNAMIVRGQVLGLAGQLPQNPCHGSVLHSGGVQGGAGGAVVRSTVHLSYTKASQPTRLAPNPSPTLPPFLASIFPLTQCAQFFPLQSLTLSYSPLLSPSPADVISHPPPLSWLAGR